MASHSNYSSDSFRHCIVLIVRGKMKCTISGQNAAGKSEIYVYTQCNHSSHAFLVSLSVLAKAIHSFARIGNYLFMEATSKGLSLRTVNSTKSAFAMILFKVDFFINFIVKSSDDPFDNRCKLLMKSCLGVFRNMKQVNSLLFILSPNCLAKHSMRCRLNRALCRTIHHRAS